MVNPVDVIQIYLQPDEVMEATCQSLRAEIGGTSQIRAAADRMASLTEDQIVGQMTQMAFSLFLTGGILAYRTQRHFCNVYPKEGDGGSDIPGTNLDVKGSLMRAGGDPLRYNLLVRPKERGPQKVYVLALTRSVPPPGKPGGVYLVGWATDTMLPEMTEAAGPFKGAHRLPAEMLNPLMPVQWWNS